MVVLDKRIIDDINVITGIAQYQRSGKGGPETLGQTQIVEEHSQSRADEEQSQVEDFVSGIYRRLLQLNQAFLQDYMSFEITGEDGSSEWLDVGNENIEGELDLDVESGSMVKLDDDVIRKQTQDAYNLLIKAPESQVIKKDLMVAVLESLPAMKQTAEKLKTAPPPPPPPPPPPKDTVGSVTFNLADMWLVLGEQEKQQILKQFGIDYQPQELEPAIDDGTGPINPEMLNENAPDESDIRAGVNQVR